MRGGSGCRYIAPILRAVTKCNEPTPRGRLQQGCTLIHLTTERRPAGIADGCSADGGGLSGVMRQNLSYRARTREPHGD
jgi:hypothetical protein